MFRNTFYHLFTAIYLFNFASSQFNGDFWWLHDKVKAFHGTGAPPAQFEALSGFETDEGDKIIYKSLEVDKKQKITSDTQNTSRTGSTPIVTLHFPDWNRLWWSPSSKYNQNNDHYSQPAPGAQVTNNTALANSDSRDRDEFSLKFPGDDNSIWENEIHDTSDGSSTNSQLQGIVLPTNTVTAPKLEHKDELTFNYHKQRENNTENICSYMVEYDCRRRNGSVYKSERSQTLLEICCILPLEAEQKSEGILFPDNIKPNLKRHSRSLEERLKVLKQRTAIQQQGQQANKRIVTPDEDDYDPYDNIRNNRQRRPNSQVFNYPFRPEYEDSVEDEEYADELPRPGMVGLYSDPGHKPWPAQPGDIFGESVIDEEVGYRLPTLDTRLDDRVSVVIRPSRRKPSRLSALPKYEKGIERITYQSNPDFKVMQGFKLMNLVRNRSRILSKARYESNESLLDENQAYGDCGEVEDVSEEYIGDDSQEDVRQGSHPWLALVLSKRQQRRLCYATLVHLRAAITSTSCVSGSSPGDIVIYAGGAWDQTVDSSLAQRRNAQVLVHPRYAEDESNDMALLHWSRPLQISGTVKVVCLDDPQAGETCQFLGLGDGKGLRRQPPQQRATVLPPVDCQLRNRGFCAAVDGNFVAGTGAALFCRRGGRWAAVGMTARRDTPVPLLPLRAWTRNALAALDIA